MEGGGGGGELGGACIGWERVYKDPKCAVSPYMGKRGGVGVLSA